MSLLTAKFLLKAMPAIIAAAPKLLDTGVDVVKGGFSTIFNMADRTNNAYCGLIGAVADRISGRAAQRAITPLAPDAGP